MLERNLVRVTVTPSLLYNNSCVLKATSFSDVDKACNVAGGFGFRQGNAGYAIAIVQYLALYLSHYFQFQFKPPNSTLAYPSISPALRSLSLNQTDTLANLLMPLEEAINKFSYSHPVLYSQTGFVVSAITFEAHNTDIAFLPFDRTSTIAIILIAFTVTCFEAVAKLHCMPQAQGGTRTYWYFFLTSILTFGEYVGLENRIRQSWKLGWRIGMTTICFWSFVLFSMYNSVFGASLLHQEKAPFSNMETLEKRVQAGLNQVLVQEHDEARNVFANNRRYPFLSATYLTVGSVAEAIAKIRQNPQFVLAINSITGQVAMNKRCGEFAFIPVPFSIDQGYSFIFRRKSHLIEKFNVVIARHQISVQLQAQSMLKDFECPRRAPVHRNVISMDDMHSVLISFGCLYMLASVFVVSEYVVATGKRPGRMCLADAKQNFKISSHSRSARLVISSPPV